MRKLKFKIWDFCAEGFVDDGASFPIHECCYDGEVTYLQYTGLKDKNGKEIYEGDIVKLNELNYEVMYVDGQFIATCPYYNKHHWPKFEHFAREARCAEVIGNVFENRELLKK